MRYFQFPPNLVRRKLIDLTNYVPSSSPRGVLSFTQRFSKTRNMAADVRCNLWLFLRRMKACIDEFQPNTSQGNYFEGFWRIPSKTNKIEVRKQFESCGPIADSSWHDVNSEDCIVSPCCFCRHKLKLKIFIANLITFNSSGFALCKQKTCITSVPPELFGGSWCHARHLIPYIYYSNDR